MHYLIGVIGLVLFLGLAFAPSHNLTMLRTKAPWVAVMLVIQFCLGLLMLKTGAGKWVIDGIKNGFQHLLDYAGEGTSFVFGAMAEPANAWDTSIPMAQRAFPFFTSVLMPIIFISALIGILQHIRVLPLIMKYLGLALSKVTGMGKLESFNAVASAFIGQSEVFISVKRIIPTMPSHRLYALTASAMSTVSMSIVGAYMTMIDAKYVVAAIVLNLFGSFIVVSLLNPYVLTPEENQIVEPERKAQSFFEMLTEYIMDGARVALTVAAMLVGFVALIALVNGIFSGIFNGTTFQDVLGYVFSPFAFMTGVPWHEAQTVGETMATKLVSNEFVAMLPFTDPSTPQAALSPHSKAIVQTFLVSFANFSSIGIIAGAIKALAPEQGDTVAKFGLKLLYGATLVSFISATVVGLIS